MLEDYLKAQKLGEREFRKAKADGRNPYPDALDDLVENIDTLSTEYVGIAEIPLNMIAGTKTSARQNSFADNFMPIMDADTEFAGKWSRVYDYQMSEGITDPVEVYEYMRKFYVKEGNKRVSVMRFLNMVSIPAEITRILPERTDDPQVQLYYEFVKFYRVAPIYEIAFSRSGSYEKLAQIVGQNLTDKWPEELVRNVEGSFFRFRSVYLGKGGDRLSITSGDAFLKYLDIYTMDSLLDKSRSLLETRVTSIWNELLVDANVSAASLQEAPVQGTKPGMFASLFSRTPAFSEAKPLHCAFIHDSDPDHSAWVNDNEIGRIYLNHSLEGLVVSEPYFNCAKGDSCRKAIDAAVKNGADVIFTTSPVFMMDTLRAALDYPKVRFINASCMTTSNAVRTYFARLFEVKFLLGMTAAMHCDNHRIGYLADFPVYGTPTTLNAFAIGAAMIDPAVKIYLKWDCVKDESWQAFCQKNDIHVFSGADEPEPMRDDTAYGVFAINEDGTVSNIAAPNYNFGRFFELIVKPILDGSWNTASAVASNQSLNYWWGMSSGVVDINMSSSSGSYYERRMIDFWRDAIMKGEYSPFEGELHSQKGVVQMAGAGRMASEKIMKMDWLNDNVIGTWPEYETMSEHGREMFDVCGIKEKA